jgi:hypothetical protein
MAKLTKEAQAAAEEAKEGYSLLPEGVYVVKLDEVDSTGQGDAGPYWTWIWKIVSDASGQPTSGTLWDRISLSPKAAFKVKQVFGAMGYTLDSDTDEMVGDECRVIVDQAEISSGKRRGEMGNNVVQYLPLDEPVPAVTGDDSF